LVKVTRWKSNTKTADGSSTRATFVGSLAWTCIDIQFSVDIVNHKQTSIVDLFTSDDIHLVNKSTIRSKGIWSIGSLARTKLVELNVTRLCAILEAFTQVIAHGPHSKNPHGEILNIEVERSNLYEESFFIRCFISTNNTQTFGLALFNITCGY
jgi:hypothetical protein